MPGRGQQRAVVAARHDPGFQPRRGGGQGAGVVGQKARALLMGGDGVGADGDARVILRAQKSDILVESHAGGAGGFGVAGEEAVGLVPGAAQSLLIFLDNLRHLAGRDGAKRDQDDQDQVAQQHGGRPTRRRGAAVRSAFGYGRGGCSRRGFAAVCG